MFVKCNVCNNQFELVGQTRAKNDGIEEVYFTCSHCGTEYFCYRTNKKMRNLLISISQYHKALKKYPLHLSEEEAKELEAGLKKVLDIYNDEFKKLNPKE